jgi:glutaredoxin
VGRIHALFCREQVMIEIYGKINCNYCTSAVDLCRTLKLDYKYYHLDQDYTLTQLWDKVKFKTFPQVFVDGVCIGGFSELLEFTNGS